MADILALLGNTRSSTHFSFLNKSRFLTPKTKLGSMFRATVRWHSGREVSRLLSEAVDTIEPELVKYVPQNYLETICSELKESRESLFDRELMEVIFSHVSNAERLGKETLPELIDYLTNEKEALISQLATELSEVNAAIVVLEDQMTEEYRKSLDASLEQRRAELKAHDEAKPVEIKEPEQDAQAQDATKLVTGTLAELQRKTEELDQQLAGEREQLRESALQIVAADKLLARIENLERHLHTFYMESEEDGSVLDLNLKEFVILMVNRLPISGAKTKAVERSQLAKTSLDADAESSLAAQLCVVSAQADENRLQLTELHRRYQQYLQQHALWQKKRDEIEGSAENGNSLKGIEAKLTALQHLPALIDAQQKVRTDLVREIFKTKEQLLADYRRLYFPVQAFIDQHEVSQQQGALQFSASITVDGFGDRLLDMIHQGRRGRFQGEQDGQERIREILANSDFSTETGIQAFLMNIQDHLGHDKREGNDKPVRLRDQLRQGTSPHDVYNFLYGLSYLRPGSSYDGKVNLSTNFRPVSGVTSCWSFIC